ncbi:glycosyltransferase family 39 protein [Tabrizicola sp. J26]|uniref:ArnT family glycosyltransferase n=1 Tax=Alitabrizicola rongguiensis TaxID=2909234 RepID=UPI001F1FA69A|nr:glycosyltransferase family 39 protein [Tabrizicola rongguiensis]MCF1707999.1 glycosyltransferase family 39 protein [Tabrizicola rongguiensis]
MQKSETDSGWLALALAIVAAITAARLVFLAYDGTDLFVDEAQYWFWGQNFDFGYYSKPPLIAWVIGATTTLAGSDNPFWVRLPAPLFHAAAALILAALAARIYGRAAAIWVAALYVTLPMVTVGSLMISTDTIMAPFFAAAVLFHRKLVENGEGHDALLAGVMVGLAFLAKYAAVYFLIGAVLGAILFRDLRLSIANWVRMILACGLVILPNILWNLANGMATAEHTLDNVGWIREGNPLAHLNPAGMAEFFFSQFAVFGPIAFAALILAAIRPGREMAWRLLVFVVPAILIVTVQALLDRAFANWAASAYFAGSVVAVAFLLRHRSWLIGAIALNAIIAVLLPVLTVVPGLTLGNDKPLLARWLGREDMSLQILAVAKAQGNLPIVAERRDILADLFYTGRDAGIAVYAEPPKGRPENHYAQTRALPATATGPVIFVGEAAPECAGHRVDALGPLDGQGGAYAKVPLALYRLDAECLNAP